MRVYAVATRSRIAGARVLAHAVASLHGTRLQVVGAGGPASPDEPFDPVDLAAVDERLPVLVRAHPWPAAHLLVGIATLRHALRAGERAVLLDPESALLAPLDPLTEALERASLVVVPRVAADLPDDGRRPSRDDLVEQGLHEPALLAARPDGAADAALEWWWDRVLGALRRLPPHRRAALRQGPVRELSEWLSLLPSRFPECVTATDPGLAASAWNLHERPLARDGDGEVRAGGRPLRLLSFAGFDPTKPHWLSAGGNRVRVPEDPVLAELCADRADALLDAGWEPPAAVAVGTALPNGLVLDDRMAQLYVDAELEGTCFGDLEDLARAEEFARWLAEPVACGGRHGVNRYTSRVWSERPDVVRVFSDLDSDVDGAGYARWLWEWGRAEMGVPTRLLPPPPPDLPPSLTAGAAADGADGVGGADPPAVHVTGFMRGALGLGAAARLYAEALHAAGIPVGTTTVDPPRPASTNGDRLAYAEVDYDERPPPEGHESAVDLVCVNADELPGLARQLGDRYGAGRRTIGVWAWETDHIPERWRPSFDLVDEIWVYTKYIAEHIGRVSPVPVIPIPIPVPVPDPGDARVDLDVPDGPLFLFVFDFLSTAARKNPAGAIEAFTRAFGPGEGPQLVIKSLHADMRPQAYDELRFRARDRPDVHLVDTNLTIRERDALMARCDCYVSLHRAEGFGLTMAEAMALGKPTIATAYSGNLDFMTPMNSYLVDYVMAPVGPDGEQYPAEGMWADPDLDHAAALMRAVVERPDEARRKGEQARRDVAEQLSPAAVGRLIRARLQTLRAAGAL